MGYSNFKKIQQVVEKFQVKTRVISLFPAISEILPSDWLTASLEIAYFAPLSNEKSKSERLVSPILLEVLSSYREQLSFFSGQELDINAQDDLSGACDFFFALSPPSMVLEAPIISLAEAKDEDMEWGLAQCCAQMYASYLFNENQDKKIDCLYGCATTGVEWQFIRFEDNCFYIDRKPMTNLPQILGTWHWIINFFLKNDEYKKSK
ncbi:MAG: hypothetical protein EAZ85_07525 [Bacteroidetes bacterium]|nr:MAG: hypothetical protein EAZ85_07525 [Bacteroidota bacterium]TAG87220.1 MAG: hypothetical protein EAZ20_11080 [Bacteroidota bacterium]